LKKETLSLINRDISWLSFNDRVLQEANDPGVPLLERLKFLGIHSSNLDEFFRVRVATIRRIKKTGGSKASSMLGGFAPDLLLKQIQEYIYRQQEHFEEAYEDILKELAMQGIFIINETQLTAAQGQFVKQYFLENVMPALVPIMLDNTPQFPYLRDRGIYFLVAMTLNGKKEKVRHALMEIPNSTSRFIVLPKENKYVILLDDVIRYCLDDVFFNFDYDSISAYTMKITRDAELDIEQDVTKSLVKKVSESLKKRRTAQAVRLTYDDNMPQEILSFLLKRLHFGKDDHHIPGGRYHNFVDFINFPSLNKAELRYAKLKPLPHKILKARTSLLAIIRHQDILLNFPYQSYHYIIDVLREASMDPKVKSINITLYRAGKDSHVINTLINAIKNGKQVTVVVELQARFDEEANIRWANKLQDEGAKIIYGVPGLKAHSKLFLITRSEQGKDVYYAHIGTGNFNEDTAKLYCDHSLLTADKNITEEVARIFLFYKDNYKTGTYKHLIVSPFYMRKKFLHLISKETENAKAGKEAWIFLKMNSLTDIEMIRKLYDASKAGVKIRLIIRSICSLVPGIKDLSENIEVISIVDKYLEHSRVFIFFNECDHKIYLSSGDWMPRNLDHRSEVAVPVYDPAIKEELKQILELQWLDTVKARVINAAQDNQYRRQGLREKTRAQDAIYKFLS
jgi:polyphosphate kinase